MRVAEHHLERRPLGRTGLDVSCLSLGTVELGLDYGIPSVAGATRPTEAEAVRLLGQAAEAGIKLFDTAPAYGDSERLVGLALSARRDCLFATKVTVPAGPALERDVLASLERSLRLLRRDVLDLVQIHNATPEMLTGTDLLDVLGRARRQGRIRCLGASVYGEPAALAALAHEEVDVIQVAYNLLDQRMADRVLPEAARRRKGVLVRSALLKGALTVRSQALPAALDPLRQAAERARETLAGSWEALPDVALRFCLAAPHVASVLIGTASPEELSQALRAAQAGPLPASALAQTASLALSDERLLNPSYWPNAS